MTNLFSKRFVPAAVALLATQLCVPAQPAATDAKPAAPKTLNTPWTFPPIASLDEWRARARDIREQLLVSAGLWPVESRPPLKPVIFGKVTRDGYTIEKVYFATRPGFYLAGNLYRPLGHGNGPFPAVLNTHGHWDNGRMVDEKDCSLAGRSINFALQGMVAFTYDMIGYNDTRFADSPAENQAAHHHFAATDKSALLWNVNLGGLQLWNSIRALDFLESLPDVDHGKLAITGESGGGTQTFMLGAVDDRLAAQAPAVMVSHTMQGGCLCENMPGARVEFSNVEIAASAAPRPQIMVGATGDWTKTMLEMEGPSVAGIYRLFKRPERIRYVRFDFGHNYNQTSREAVYAWFDQWLEGKPSVAAVKEIAFQKEPDAELRVWPENKPPADALTEAQFIAAREDAARAELARLQPTNLNSLAHYKNLMLPAWRHTLQVGPSRKNVTATSLDFAGGQALTLTRAGQSNSVKAVLFNSTKPSPAGAGKTLVVLSHPDGLAAYCTADRAATGLAARLLDAGISVMLVDTRQPEKPFDEFSRYFTTYNRTSLQQRIGEIVAACDYAKAGGGFFRVMVCGTGSAGLWALLAAPAADGVIADANSFDVASDEAMLAPGVYCPGLRKLGAFEGVAMLAAPNPLLIANAGPAFPTGKIQSVYAAAKAPAGMFTRAEAKLDDEAIVKWVAGQRRNSR